jgi:hypothetical protein
MDVMPVPNGKEGNSFMDRKIINRIGINIGNNDFTKEGPSLLVSNTDFCLSELFSILYFEAMLIENNQPTINPTTLTGKPNNITIPRSASRMPAAATGPGVGGIR